jgi:hypothetical protein
MMSSGQSSNPKSPRPAISARFSSARSKGPVVLLELSGPCSTVDRLADSLAVSVAVWQKKRSLTSRAVRFRSQTFASVS